VTTAELRLSDGRPAMVVAVYLVWGALNGGRMLFRRQAFSHKNLVDVVRFESPAPNENTQLIDDRSPYSCCSSTFSKSVARHWHTSPIPSRGVPMNSNGKRAWIYVRVSTADQNPDLQIREFEEYAHARSWDVTEIYRDIVSGGSVRRAGLDRLINDAHARKFECVLIWKLDRLGRSLPDCLSYITALDQVGIRLIATTQGIDTDQHNPSSRFLLHVLGAAAEFERSLIRERTDAGRVRYRQDFTGGRVGKTVHSRSGRDLAPHRPKKLFDREQVSALRKQGLSLRAIARQMVWD